MGLKSSLTLLSALHEPNKTGPPKDKVLAGKQSKKHLSSILVYGSLLSKLASGRAIILHFQAIEPELRTQNRHNRSDKLDPCTQYDAEPDDEELKAVQPFTITEGGALTPLWKAFRDWLRLISIHFKSAGILTTHAVSNPSPRIDIRLVVSPQDPNLDKKQLPWKALFASPNTGGFPISSPSTVRPVRTNAEILNFLQTGTETAPAKQRKQQDTIKTTSTSNHLGKLSIYLAQIALKNPISHPASGGHPSVPLDAYGWGKDSRDILALLFPGEILDNARLTEIMAMKYYDLKDPLPKKVIDDINVLLHALDDSADFFRSLTRMENDFGGSLHCEACLASLIVPNSKYDGHDTVKHLAGFDRIIGVSKRCCPVCRHLLFLLERESTANSEPAPIHVKGSHGTITACTLPMWLPAGVVDIMVETFGAQLRLELLNLMKDTGKWRKRSQSSGSGGRSTPDHFGGNQGGIEIRDEADINMIHFPEEEDTPQL